MSEEPEVCTHCGVRLLPHGMVVKGEWSHVTGSTYCQTPNGYTATPLSRATPAYYPSGAVL